MGAPGRRVRRRRGAAGLAASVLLAGLAAGCTTARSALGTSDSSCYQAIPSATKAVGGHGRLLGLHPFTLASLRNQAPHMVHELATKAPGSQRLCVVAFEGRFDRHSVSAPRGQSTGRLAVVVSTTPANHLLGTVIFTRPPLHFGHTHFG
jgi:hypothetical protein